MTTLAQFVFSDLQFENRVFKEADALIRAGLVERAICYGNGRTIGRVAHASVSRLDIEHVRVPSASFLPKRIRQLVQAVFWTFSVAALARKTRPILIQAHDLSALPAGVLAKWLTGAKLHYDAHELESERAGWSLSLRRVARIVERSLLRHADLFTTVSYSISEWYAQNYMCSAPVVVLNATEAAAFEAMDKAYFHRKFSIPAQSLVYLYVGLLDNGRGIDWIIEAFGSSDCSAHVVLMGFGALTEKAKTAAQTHASIHYHDAVPQNQVARYSAAADVGLVTIEPVSQSYLYAMPNKLFECRAAGIPVIVTNLPDMAKMIGLYGGGWIIEPDAASLAALVGDLDRGKVDAMNAAAKPFPTWNEAQAALVEAVRKTIGTA